jgi:hypothetical protein
LEDLSWFLEATFYALLADANDEYVTVSEAFFKVASFRSTY